MENNKLLVIDGFNLLSRGYFATAYNKTADQLSRNSHGLYTNALRVFMQKLFNLINQHQTTHLAIAWDVKREETDRRKKYDFYKASRNELPEPLIQQYETLIDVLNQLGVAQLTLPPHEADDVIGSLAYKWSTETDHQCLIYSNDKDLLQLLNSQTSQVIAQKRVETVYTYKHFQEEYGIEPYQWIEVKALLGDASDNIPGVPGVGAKSALPLIQDYQSIDQLYKTLLELDSKYNRYKKKLLEGEKLAKISKELVTINCAIDYFDDFDLMTLSYHLQHTQIRHLMESLELNIRLH
ncbi:5'-3' exonuclease [Amphibacillus cookii]|uniref:5'-3' exonuclease n=1 Tax=Amphibacillus cookii TaxID=767787 RepID=UPI00195E0521|nr:5'-3' exonuclease [Amphibacillus cookii]MBM7540227.1 5'-3' exonuclease [Amphibacillus cookii]